MTSNEVTHSTKEAVEIRDFEVRVDNKAAGTHRLTIKSNGDKHEVAFQTDVKMDFVIYAYVFKSRGTEVWRDGRLELLARGLDDADGPGQQRPHDPGAA